MIDLIREILQTMRNNRLRTFLTGVSVAWGIFMLIILLGASRGVYNAANSGFASNGANVVQVWGGVTSKPYKGYKEGRGINLKDGDMAAIADNIPDYIENATAQINLKTTIISTPKDYMSGSCSGVYPNEAKLRGHTIVYGRFINEADLGDARKVVVLNDRTAGQLFDSPAQAVGEYVSVGDLSFKVIGVYSARWGQTAYIPYTTAYMLNGYNENVDMLVAEMKNVHSEADGDRVEQDIRNTLSQQHDTDPGDNSAYWVWNRFKQNITMNNGLNILNIVIWLIGIFTLLSGIIGVSNIMFVSVKERTHEIGIRRAIGAKPRQILTQILMESLSITGLFGYIGIAMGIGFTELLNSLVGETDFMKNPTVDVSIAVEVTVVLIIAGALAGLFPALKALKVKPVEALRDE